MSSQSEELTAIFLGERHRFANDDGDVIVADAHANGSINGPVAIKGQADFNELKVGVSYLFSGEWKNYKNKRRDTTERQFVFTGFCEQQPNDRAGIIAYLRDAGQGLGFGTGRATALWEEFGSQAVQVFRENPRLVHVSLAGRGLPLSEQACQTISTKLVESQALESCKINLVGLLNGRGFRKNLPKLLLDHYGASAYGIICRDPFKLLPFPGCFFGLCDKMYLSLGLPAGRLKRQALAAWHAIHSNSDGHTWMGRETAVLGIKSCIAGADLRIDKAIRLTLRAGLLREIRTDGVNGPISPTGGTVWLASSAKADKEARLARLIADAMSEPFEWPEIASIKNIDGEQPEVLAMALRGPIAILRGRPGSGKTHTLGNAIKALTNMYGDDQVGVGAPTNLAAARLTEAMAEYKVPTRARTWHSLLGKAKQRGKQWRHDADNPFPFKVLVGDEESMKDCDIACAVFEARAKGTLVLLVGDVNQLLPVGHGAPLRDMIAAGLPSGELRDIRRNSGGIVEACAAIVDGKPWGPGDNLDIIEVNDHEQQVAAILQQLELCQASGLDPIWDTRIIACRNETRRTLNKVLQAHLNHNPGIEGSPFRVGDKIINRESGMFPLVSADLSDEEIEVSDSGSDVKVANGEVGRVLSVEEKYFTAKLSYPDRTIRIPRGKVSTAPAETDKTGTGCSWELAYAVTFHSSQGSEFPWAILVASTRDGRMGCRELVYTGISRGKVKSKLIGPMSVWKKFCKNVALNKRKTLLKEQILLERAKLELGGF